MSEWLDIKTAPKDGTAVDLWDGYGRETNVFWDGEHWTKRLRFVPDRNRPAGSRLTGVWRVKHVNPSHWMPLPEPPVPVMGGGE
jgi:hypothetical protein